MQLITNEKDGDIFIRQLLNIGEAMYKAGGEISRIEDSLHRLGKPHGIRSENSTSRTFVNCARLLA